eukprot:gene6747-367_t
MLEKHTQQIKLPLCGSSPAIFGIEHNARALASLAKLDEDRETTDSSFFLVGTLSPGNENAIHRLEFSDETEMVHKKSAVFYQGEIWSLAASCLNHNLFSVVYGPSHEKKAEAISFQTEEEELELSTVCTLSLDGTENHKYSHIECDWNPNESHHVCTMNTSGSVACWDVNVGNQYFAHNIGTHDLIHATIKWSPHQQGKRIAVGCGPDICFEDISSGRTELKIENSHIQAVRSIDFNPNNQYIMATAGDDGYIKQWDLRKTTVPLSISQSHSHWVWSIQYNHLYDRFIISSGSDGEVLLNNFVMPTNDIGDGAGFNPDSSSTVSGSDADIDTEKTIEDQQAEECWKQLQSNCIAARYEDHEDSVYRSVWSQTDTWTFASLSFDGRFLISRVPDCVKFAVLLE